MVDTSICESSFKKIDKIGPVGNVVDKTGQDVFHILKNFSVNKHEIFGKQHVLALTL